MTLRRRLALILAAVVAVLVVSTVLANGWLARSSLRASVDTQLVAQADRLEPMLTGGRRPFPGRPGSVPALERFAETFFRVQLIGPNNVADSEEIPVDPVVLRRAASGRDVLRTETIDGRAFRVLTRRVDTRTLQLATDIDSIESGLRRLRRSLLVSGILGVLAAGALGWIVARGFTKPIVEVTAAAGKLARRERAAPIVSTRSDEIGQLAASFNELQAALALSQDQQARLVSDASHELRTPLTSLGMKIEFLQSAPELTAAQRQQILDGLSIEVRSLGALVAELVELASNSSVEEQPTEIDLGALAEDVAAQARITKHREVVVQRSGTVVVARPAMVRRALSNLVDNAHKYSPAGAPIEIREHGGGFEVRDHGPGIAPADRPYAFERFYRSSQAHALPGSGIGLALVKQAADAHGGRVWIDDAAGGGAVVGFSLRESVRADPDRAAPGRRPR